MNIGKYEKKKLTFIKKSLSTRLFFKEQIIKEHNTKFDITNI
jgi:hypothetical protein